MAATDTGSIYLTQETSDTAAPRFPDYGDAGDLAGARRARRAFWLCVASSVLITFVLYYAERFLRYPDAERHYLAALSYEPERARAYLQSAIEHDRADGKPPMPRYVQALAVREEDDFAFHTFEEAYELDPADSLFAVRYGCRLYAAGKPEEALKRFREARANPPENALPYYLEAAALLASTNDAASLNDAMVIVARTNNGSQNVIFPKPLWFADLSQTGYQRIELSRQIVAEVTEPLLAFTGQIIDSTKEDGLSQGRSSDVRSWLTQLQIMGRRFVPDGKAQGLAPVRTGMKIQLAAARRLHELGYGGEQRSAEEMPGHIETIETALASLAKYEATREEARSREEAAFLFPLQMSMWTGAALLAALLAAYIPYRLLGIRLSSWTVPHKALGLWLIVGSAFLFFTLLHLQTAFSLRTVDDPSDMNPSLRVWWATVVFMLALGVVYPALTLRTPRDISRMAGRPEEQLEMIPIARQIYLRTYLALGFRYYGLLVGAFIFVFCAWLNTHRIFTGLYPWQVELRPTVLMDQESAAVATAIANL